MTLSTDRALETALDLGIFGLARVGADLTPRERRGRLMDWMADAPAKITDSSVFFAMEAEFAELRAGRRNKIDLPGLRLPPLIDTPFSLCALHEAESDDFLLFATTDGGALEFERLLAHERRQTQILQDQALAAGRAAREQAALYRDIVETASDLVFRLDEGLRFTFVNTVAARWLGGTDDGCLGRRVDEVLGSSAEESWAARLADKAAPACEQGWSFEQGWRRGGGETLWIWWSVHWVESGVSGEYQALGRDITDLRRLRAEAGARAEEARANAVMRERLRIAHDLHDTLVHSLVALAPQIRLIRKVAGAGADPRLVEELDLAEAAVRDGLTRARAALADLRRQPVEPEGLGAALEDLARRFGARTGVNVLVDLDARARTLAQDKAEAFFRIVEEALRNVELHAQASRIGVYLAADDSDGLTLVIADDGRGFDPAVTPAGHFGLIGMREQAEMIGASFSLDSAPGLGARIVIVAPARPSESFGADMRK